MPLKKVKKFDETRCLFCNEDLHPSAPIELIVLEEEMFVMPMCRDHRVAIKEATAFKNGKGFCRISEAETGELNESIPT